jgi:chorismate mutase / prephenate dehydratase
MGDDLPKSLAECRQRLDELDQQIVRILNARAGISVQVGRLKANGDHNIYAPEREVEVLRRVAENSEGPLSEEGLRRIYAEILSASRALQRPLRVAFLGPVGTFGYEASMRHFGLSSEFVPCRTNAEIFVVTQRGDADYGVVPVENSTEGAVNPVLDMFLESPLEICAELKLPIAQHLMGRGTIEQVRRVFSHPQALGQCRRWLADNLPNATLHEVSSTAAAAEMCKEPDMAAVAPESASSAFDVPILVRHIEDVANNVTRFLVIGRHGSKRTGNDRTAIVFAVRDQVGALWSALGIFARHEINLSKIESRPSKRRPWEYVFFVDLMGHPDDGHVGQALETLRSECTFVKVLGSWAVA